MKDRKKHKPKATRALLEALDNDDVKAVKEALAAGANPDAKLLGEPALHVVVRWSNKTLLDLLVEHGVDLNARDTNGDTALHAAIGDDSRAMAILLVTHGADVAVKTDQGWTPLHIAVRIDDAKLVNTLLEHGADPNATDKNNCAPLHEIRSVSVAKIFIAAGADVQVLSKTRAYSDDAYTPLHAAAKRDLASVARLLLANGADPEKAGGYGATPLHWAAEHGSQSVAALLVKKCKNLNAATKHGMTALHFAAFSGSKSIVDLLLGKGADVHIQTTAERSVWHDRTDGTLRLPRKSTAADVARIAGHKQLASQLKKAESEQKKAQSGTPQLMGKWKVRRSFIQAGSKRLTIKLSEEKILWWEFLDKSRLRARYRSEGIVEKPYRLKGTKLRFDGVTYEIEVHTPKRLLISWPVEGLEAFVELAPA